MIKTLHITNAYHASSGGIRTFYHALLDAAERHHRHVRLVVPAAQSSVEVPGPHTKVYHVKSPRSLVVDRRYRLILPHLLLDRTGPIWRILREEEPDLIEVCDKYSLCYVGGLIRRRWLKGKQRPAVIALTCERMDDNVSTFLSGSALARRFSQWYMRHVYSPQFDGHIAVSGYAARELDGSLRVVHVAHMGIDFARFGREKPTAAGRLRVFGRIGGDPRAVLLLYAGRLSPEKNLPLLLDTITALESSVRSVFHLCLAGDGPLRQRILDEGHRRAPGRVHLLGHIDGRDALAACYANADVFVHPNPREPFGLAPLEAMASGLALVAPVSGGVLEYASTDNAWLAEPTAAGFAAAVQSITAGTTERDQKLERARRTARSFDWDAVTSHYFQVYEEMHQRSAPTRPVTQPSWLECATGAIRGWGLA